MAEKIGVTDKAVSRWETGRGLPDISILKSLSDELGVSINEIMSGENIPPEKAKEKADSALLGALNYSKQMSKRLMGTIILILGICLLFFPQIFTGRRGILLVSAVGIIMSILGIALLCSKKKFFQMRKLAISKRIYGAISIIILIATIVLEALPYGAVFIFADGPESWIKRTFSYFSMILFGYANFFPLITALLTVIIMALSVYAFVKNYKVIRMQNIIFICSVVAFISSIISWILFGSSYITGVGISISTLLILSVFLQAFTNRRVEDDN